MGKITLVMLLMGTMVFAQQKSTGTVEFIPQLSAELILDNTTSIATLTVNGPADRWFAVTLGSFGAPGAMNAGNDIVYFNGTSLIDATHNGQGISPTPDAVNDWTLVSNTVSGGTRTLVATRGFGGGSGDFTFNYSAPTIDLAGSHAETAIMSPLQYHGPNRANMQNQPLTLLGVEDFSLRATQIFPNPSQGVFTIKARTALTSVAVYSNTGQLVKTISPTSMASSTELQLEGLTSGVYLIELKNDSEKVWKKVIVK